MATASNTRPGQEPVCPRCGGVGYYRRDVPLGHPDFGRAIACDCQAAIRQAARLEGLRRASNLGHLSRFTFASFVPEGYGLAPSQRENLRRAFETARAYAAKPEGWLLLMGRYGCGKTHLAAAIANHRLGLGEQALFVVVPDLLDHLRAAFNPSSTVSLDRRFEEVRNAPLLVLDDLGTQSTTPWAQEKLYQLLNHRYNAKLPTVITTNLTLEEIDARLRARILDPRRVIVFAIIAPSYLDRLSTRKSADRPRGRGTRSG